MRRVLMLAIAALPLSTAEAEPIDPALPIVVTVGSARSAAPSERLDAARSARSRVAFPDRPVEIARKNVGSLAHPPVVLPDGTIAVALSSPEILRLAADGSELARVRLGSSPAVRAPVVLPNGGLAVLTGAPSIVFISATGKVVSAVPLPKASFSVQMSGGGLPDTFASIIATQDGAVVVASGRSLLEIDASGRVAAKSALPERIVSDPLPFHGDLLVVGDLGGVFRVAPPAEPKKLGVVASAAIGSASLLDDRTLLVQATPNRLITLDLKSGVAVTRVGDSAFAMFDAPVALAADGMAWVTTIEGFLVGYDAAGGELVRVQLDRNAATPGSLLPGRFGVGIGANTTMPRVGPIVDRDGRVAFSRAQGRVGVRDVDGRIAVGADRGCNGPLAILPTAPQKLLVACREGTLIWFGEDSGAAPGE